LALQNLGGASKMFGERRNCDIAKHLLFCYLKTKKQLASLFILLFVKSHQDQQKQFVPLYSVLNKICEKIRILSSRW